MYQWIASTNFFILTLLNLTVNKDNSRTIKVGVKYWKSIQIKIMFNIKKLFKDGSITQPEWEATMR
jgi:hypothetical protein